MLQKSGVWKFSWNLLNTYIFFFVHCTSSIKSTDSNNRRKNGKTEKEKKKKNTTVKSTQSELVSVIAFKTQNNRNSNVYIDWLWFPHANENMWALKNKVKAKIATGKISRLEYVFELQNAHFACSRKSNEHTEWEKKYQIKVYAIAGAKWS